MKSRNLLVIFIALFLIIALIVVGVLVFFSSNNGEKENIFECSSFADVEKYIAKKNTAHEKHDNSIHLFNITEFGQVGYCVVEIDADTQKVTRMDFYMTFENDDKLESNIENIKDSFLNHFGFEGDYEYFPLDSESENVGEKEFLSQKASKELFVYEENITWNISWYITDEGVSSRVSKSILN